MKLSFGKRLLLVLQWLLSMLILVLVVVNWIAPQLFMNAASFINSVLGAGLAELVGIVLLAVYALISICAAAALFARKNKRADRSFITVDSSDTGRTRIAIGAVEQMIRQAVRGVDGITDLKTAVQNNEDSISIECSVAISSGAHVPTVTMNMQRAIRSYIELNCGVAVREVSVSVHTLDNGEGGKGGRKKAVAAAERPVIPAPEAIAVPAGEFVAAKEPVLEPASEPAAVPAQETVPAEPVCAEPVEEAPAASCEAQELPEIQPIVLTFDAGAPEAVEAPAVPEE